MTSILDTPRAAIAAAAPSAAPVRRALAALALSVLLSSLGTSVANVALPTLARTFGASFRSVQWIVLAYLLAVTTLVVGVGRLGDLVGRRRLLVAGIALFTAASVVCGLAPALWVLIAARAVQGLGAAVMMALTVALVAETVPTTRTGSAMGLLGTMSAVGTALGPSLGGILLAGPGWRALFLVNVPLGAVAMLLAHRHLRADRAARPGRRPAFDVVGTLLLAVTLGAYALAVTAGRGRPGVLHLALLAVAVVGLALFVRVEFRAPSPLVRLSMLRERGLGASLAANALVSTVMMTTLVVGPFYLAGALGLAPALVGLVMSVGPLVAAAAGVPAGRLADRVGTHRATVAGLAAIAVGAALVAALPATLRVAGYVGPIATLTAGYALFQTANNTAVMASVDAGDRGTVAGMLGLSRNLGLVSGASVMGAVFAFASGAPDVATASATAAASGTRITFATATVLIVGTLVLVAGRRVRRATAAAAVLLLVRATPGHAQAPTPTGPYPAAAAGWGPPAGNGLFVSRWAEDWTGTRAAGAAPPLNATPLGGARSLTVSAEARLRHDAFVNAQLTEGNDYRQTLFRGALGADVRLDRRLRVYGEAATGQIGGRRRVAGPNFQNDASLQQLFLDVRGHAGAMLLGAMLLGAMVGRQEFADGPRQLVSVSDGPNVHRTWNGARLYAHGRRFRLGAFDLRATRQARGAFDEGIDHAERIRGVNGSLVVARGPAGANVYLDPFWMHSEHPAFRSGGRTGPDERDTFGARLWGRRGAVAFDWTLARQVGQSRQRDVDAWGLSPMPAGSRASAFASTSRAAEARAGQGRSRSSIRSTPAPPTAYARMSGALARAALIVVTHEHPDHVGGRLAQPNLRQLLAVTRLTREQVAEVEANRTAAQFAPLHLPSDVLDGYRPLDYDRYQAIAPGVVPIKAPGHTPGSQMVYVRRADGVEVLFVGDVAWHQRNIETMREKARLVSLLSGEDRSNAREELAALHDLQAAHPELHIMPGHDAAAIDAFVRDGLVARGF